MSVPRYAILTWWYAFPLCPTVCSTNARIVFRMKFAPKFCSLSISERNFMCNASTQSSHIFSLPVNAFNLLYSTLSLVTRVNTARMPCRKTDLPQLKNFSLFLQIRIPFMKQACLLPLNNSKNWDIVLGRSRCLSYSGTSATLYFGIFGIQRRVKIFWTAPLGFRISEEIVGPGLCDLAIVESLAWSSAWSCPGVDWPLRCAALLKAELIGDP